MKYLIVILSFLFIGCRVTDTKAKQWMDDNRGKAAQKCDELFPTKQLPPTVDSSEYLESLEFAYQQIYQLSGQLDDAVSRQKDLQNIIEKLPKPDDCDPLVQYVNSIESEIEDWKARYKQKVIELSKNVKPVVVKEPWEDTRKIESMKNDLLSLKVANSKCNDDLEKWKGKAQKRFELNGILIGIIILLLLFIFRKPIVKMITGLI